MSYLPVSRLLVSYKMGKESRTILVLIEISQIGYVFLQFCPFGRIPCSHLHLTQKLGKDGKEDSPHFRIWRVCEIIEPGNDGLVAKLKHKIYGIIHGGVIQKRKRIFFRFCDGWNRFSLYNNSLNLWGF